MSVAETGSHSHYLGDPVNWFESEPGQSLLRAENHRISSILPDLFGYHILQLSTWTPSDLMSASRIRHKILARRPPDQFTGKNPDLVCHNSALPIDGDCIDVVLLNHVLEFEKNPHQVLREVERVLIGEGHVVILGFNPWSFWGLWRVMLAWKDRFPWLGHYFSQSRVKDWLTLLDFEIVKTEKFFFRPPIKNSRLITRLNFLEPIGRYCWPFWGGVFLIVAKKRVSSMTPIKLQWQSRRRMIASGVIEPNARMTPVKVKDE